MEDDVATVEKSSQIPQKCKITIWPGNTIPRSKPQRIGSRDSNRCFYMNIHTSQNGDAPQKFIKGATDKQTVLHPYNVILFSNKKKWAIKPQKDMEEP